ncbi:MAG: glycosyltransferase family 4 protein [Gemmatimonadales bacterium]
MRVLFVSHTYLRTSGDRAGAQVWRLALAAQARGDTTLVVAPHAPGAADAEVLDGVAVRRFRYAPEHFERIGYQGAVQKSAGSPIALALLPIYLVRFRRAVRQAVLDFRPDVLAVHWWLPGSLAAVGQGVPVVVTCHGSDVRLLSRPSPLRSLAHGVLGRVAVVTAISSTMADDLRRWTGLTDVRITPSPVDESRFDGKGATRVVPPRIFFAGNLIRGKGVDLIIRAFAMVRARGIDARLRLVGDGPHRPEFESLARELGVASEVDWAGPRPHEAMPEEFAAAAVTVLASRGPRGEGLPITLVEAMMAGSAVVSTPAGGVPEIVLDGRTGLIARDSDAAHLAEQLGRLLTDPSLRERLVLAARALVLDHFARAPAESRYFEALDQAAGSQS